MEPDVPDLMSRLRGRTSADQLRVVLARLSCSVRADDSLPAPEPTLARLDDLLQRDPSLHRRILDSVPGGVVFVSASGAILQANDEACRILGLSYDEISRLYVADFSPTTVREDGSPCPVEDYPVSRCLATGQPQPPMTIGVTQPGGELCWAVFRAVPVADPDTATLLGAVVTFLDVTEPKRVEDELRRSEGRFRALVQHSPQHIAVLDAEARILYINRAGEGHSRQELIGRSCLELCRPAERPLFAEAVRGAIEAGRVTRHEGEDVESGRVYESWIAPLPGAEGSSKALLISADITERRRADEARQALDARLQEAQRLESLGVLAGGVAHDFNNFLLGLQGNLELALRTMAPADAARPFLDDARTISLRAAELTRELLAYSGQGRFVLTALNLNQLVGEMIRLLGASVSRKATVRLEATPDLPAVYGDATQLRQVVMNLITNAAEALPPGGGTVSVATRLVPPGRAAGSRLLPEPSAERYVLLEVRDDGVGMSPDQLGRIFEPFYSTKFTGRGLGLAAVLGIVRGHQGGIEVESLPGQGSSFRVFLPASSEQAPAPSEAAPAAPPNAPAGVTVLVVDDEDHIRRVVRSALELEGYGVVEASNGQEAVERYRSQPGRIGVVLLDLLMPDMDGEETLRALLKLDPGVRVILSSGYTEETATDRLAGLPLVGFLHKPYRLDELSQAVRAAAPEPGAP